MVWSRQYKAIRSIDGCADGPGVPCRIERTNECWLPLFQRSTFASTNPFAYIQWCDSIASIVIFELWRSFRCFFSLSFAGLSIRRMHIRCQSDDGYEWSASDCAQI